MDISIIIAAIAAIFSCVSCWVAYKAYLNSTATRKADKLLAVRIQVLELRNIAQHCKQEYHFLSKKQPTTNSKDLSEIVEPCIHKIEELHTQLCSDHLKLTEKNIDDMTITLHKYKREMELEFEKIKKLSP